MSHAEMGLKLRRTKEAVHHRLGALKFIKSPKSSPIKIGEKFGYLTIISKTERKSKEGNYYYICNCNCGNTIEAIGASLRKNHTKSCGCFQLEKVRKKIGEVSFNMYETTYKKTAEKHKIPYKLTTEEFRFLIVQNCHYCDGKPRLWNIYYTKCVKMQRRYLKVSDDWAQKQGVYINGIDRVDSSRDIGYTIGNCVPCCTDCNIAKLDRTVKEFLDHVERIHSYQTNKGEYNEKKLKKTN